MKGVTPIVAIIILLLIVIAIAGVAFSYISSYFSTTTGKVIQLRDSYENSVVINNIGTQRANEYLMSIDCQKEFQHDFSETIIGQYKNNVLVIGGIAIRELTLTINVILVSRKSIIKSSFNIKTRGRVIEYDTTHVLGNNVDISSVFTEEGGSYLRMKNKTDDNPSFINQNDLIAKE